MSAEKAGPKKIATSRRIKAETLRVFAVASCVLGLVAWNHAFFWQAVSSNLYLNGVIIAVFLFGFFLAFQNILRLRNEEVALLALKEAFEDIQNHHSRSKRDPYWRHYRCLEPGYVFSKPRIFGHVFDLTYDKIMRAKHLRISVGTMQSLVREVEMRFASERSLLQYVTGILVFLGLIGTFVGLMDVVGSVGDILRSIALTTSDARNSATVLESLMTDLQAPLTGMATGFSSSLFGLFGSLTLGLVTQFLQRATAVLKGQFESWLANIAEIEGENEQVAASASGTGEGGVASGVDIMERLVATLEQQAERPIMESDLFDRLVESNAVQNQRLEEMTLHLDKLASGIEDIRDGFSRQTALSAASTQAQRDATDAARQTHRAIVEGLSGVEAVVDRLSSSQAEQLAALRAAFVQSKPAFDQELVSSMRRAFAEALEAARTMPGSAPSQPSPSRDEELWAIDWMEDVDDGNASEVKDYKVGGRKDG